MICGFEDPWKPLFMDLDIPIYFKIYKRHMETFFKHDIRINLKFLEIKQF